MGLFYMEDTMPDKKAPKPAEKRHLRVSVKKITEIRFFDDEGDEFFLAPHRTHGYAGAYMLTRVPK